LADWISHGSIVGLLTRYHLPELKMYSKFLHFFFFSFKAMYNIKVPLSKQKIGLRGGGGEGLRMLVNWV
jgi:hypothetical protein